MRTSAKRLIVLPLLAVLFVFLAPTSVLGQCVVSSTTISTFAPTRLVYKFLTAPATCSATASNNVNGCFPGLGAPLVTGQLTASAQTTATGPSCSFNCSCGSVTIDGSDGLPVELLQFGVEEESPTPEAIKLKEITGKLEED